MADNRELALVLKLVADQFQSELKNSQGALGTFNNFIKDWRTQLAAASTALLAIAKSTAAFGEEALKTSERLGLTVQQTTALGHAAHMADVPVATLERSLKTLSQNTVEAARGMGDGAKLFTTLGISATDAAGKIKPLDQLFFEFQDRLNDTATQAEFLDAGVKAFGKSFLELVPMIRQGSSATREAMEEAKRFGIVLTRDQAEAARRFNDELKRLMAASQGLTLQVGNALIPVLTDLIKLFRELGVGTGLSFGLKVIQEQVIRLSTLFKELQANAQFLFGTGKDNLTLGELRKRIDDIEAEGRQRLFELKNPGVLTPSGAGSSGGGAGAPGRGSLLAVDTKQAGAEQERLGKALLDIHLAMNRAIEIRNGLMREGTNLYFLAFDRQQQLKQIDEQEQERRGKAIVERTQMEVRYREAALAQEAAIQERRGRMIVEATQLEVKIREEALAKQAEANRTFFDEWTDGMRRYVHDIKTGMGFGADMARRTAQVMEQNFRTFFFDLMEGRIQSFKDVLKSFAQFVKQIISQILSQLVTMQMVKLGLSAAGAFSGIGAGAAAGGNAAIGVSGYSPISGFAEGGPVMGSGISDSIPALLTPGEYVLSRQDVQDLKMGKMGGAPSISITVNAGGGQQASGSGATPSMMQLARDLSKLVEAKIVEEQRPGGLLARGAA